MRTYLVFFLTFLAFLFLFKQFRGKKGDKPHKRRGYWIFGLTLTVVIINTVAISMTKGLIWDMPFIVHTGLGLTFFLFLLTTIGLGIRADKNPHLRAGKIHGLFAHLTLGFMVLTILAIGLIWFAR